MLNAVNRRPDRLGDDQRCAVGGDHHAVGKVEVGGDHARNCRRGRCGRSRRSPEPGSRRRRVLARRSPCRRGSPGRGRTRRRAGDVVAVIVQDLAFLGGYDQQAAVRAEAETRRRVARQSAAWSSRRRASRCAPPRPTCPRTRADLRTNVGLRRSRSRPANGVRLSRVITATSPRQAHLYKTRHKCHARERVTVNFLAARHDHEEVLRPHAAVPARDDCAG